MVRFDTVDVPCFVLTAEGKSIAQNGSHEAVVFHAIPAEGLDMAQLPVSPFVNMMKDTRWCACECHWTGKSIQEQVDCQAGHTFGEECGHHCG